MDNELDETSKKVKMELANYLGVEPEDIEDESTLTGDLHMKATDLTDFMVKLGENGFATENIDLMEIETFGDLIETLTAHL